MNRGRQSSDGENHRQIDPVKPPAYERRMSKQTNTAKNLKVVSSKPRGGGRPRSETTRRAILTATLKLLREMPIQTLTIEAIAKEAGVSKATIYRWWDSKASVVIDAFIEDHIVHTPMRHDIHPAEALLLHWRSLAEQYASWPGKVVGQILAEGQSDPAVQREFRERFYYGRRAIVTEAFEQLRIRCPQMPDIAAEYLIDMLYSTVYRRLMLGYGAIGQRFIREFPIDFFSLLGIEFDEHEKVVG